MENKIKYHPQRTEIEKDIIDGMSNVEIAKKYSTKVFKLSKDTVRRYRENNLPGVMQFAQTAHGEGVARQISDSLEIMQSVQKSALDSLRDPGDPRKISVNPSTKEMKIRWYDREAKKGGYRTLESFLTDLPDEIEVKGIYGNAQDPRTTLFQATDKILRCMELISKTRGFINDGTTVNVNSQSTRMTTSEIAEGTKQALTDYPEALDAWINWFMDWCAQKNEEARKAIEYSNGRNNIQS